MTPPLRLDDLMAEPIDDEMDPEGMGEQDQTSLAALDEDADTLDMDALKRRAIAALYGMDCPFASGDEVTDANLVAWARALWDRHASAAQEPQYVAERNRLMRKGVQWLSRETPTGPYTEPPQPRDSVRPVANMVRPALAQRLQVLTEQRPGFRCEAGPQDPAAEKRAEAQQQAVEYQFHEQRMRLVMKEAAFWAQTDGMSVLFSFWDPDAGPWSEYYTPEGTREKMGDIRTIVLRLEEVRVSANASATCPPFYWVIRKPIATAEAVQRHGPQVLAENQDHMPGDERGSGMGLRGARQGALSSTPDDLLRDQDTLERFWVVIEPSEVFPNGFLVHVVGEAVVYAEALPDGCATLVRVTDGSEDPNWYPEPIMNDWLDDQMRVNVTLRQWIEGVRRNIGGRILYRANAVSAESLVGGLASNIPVKGVAAIRDALEVVPHVPVAAEVKELLQMAVTSFENKSGWNDTSRGSFGADQSGRSVLAQREILERIFAPPVDAMASALTEWAKIQLKIMARRYDEPRQIAVVGESRPDLGRMLTQEDFDGIAEVQVDPETLMPLPRSLRLFLLDQMFDKGQMSAAEYRRRSPFASVRNLTTPDDDQEAAARRLADRIRQGADPMAEPLWWQWNEAIFQDVLERELILDDGVDGQIRMNADALWKRLAEQAAMKQGGVPGPGAPPSLPGQPSGGNVPTLQQASPQGAPLASGNPGVAAAPMGMQSDTERLAGQFDAANAQ